MQEMIENRMVLDSEWSALENSIPKSVLQKLPVCGCCEEKIIQERAHYIFFKGKWIWICDSCADDLKLPTGLEE